MAATAPAQPTQGKTTQGKTAGEENFPVGSRLIPAALRPHVAAYYRFARLADDIADSPTLSPEDKISQLDALDAVLLGQGEGDDETRPAALLRRALLDAQVDLAHASELLIAFRRDARNEGCQDWAALMTYCRHSAAPVGRFLLDLHGEDRQTFAAGDALCSVHQILNHIQDVRADYVELARVYVPTDWLRDAGLNVTDLDQARCSAPLRQVLDRMLDGCEELIEAARPLPGQIKSRGLRMETKMIHVLAERLLSKLRRRDPLAETIKLGPMDWVRAGLSGLLKGGLG